MKRYLERTVLNSTSTNKGHNNCHYVDSELKLKELSYAVIDIASPHHCLHYAAEVVICEDDVGCLFGDICSGNTL
jgi:hypothetical protein